MIRVYETAKAAYSNGLCTPVQRTYMKSDGPGHLACCGLAAACVGLLGPDEAAIRFRQSDRATGEIIGEILDIPKEYRFGFMMGFDRPFNAEYPHVMTVDWQAGYKDGSTLAKELFDV